MKIQTKIKFEEEYLPTKRHRIPRIRRAEEDVALELREIQKENAPVALVVTDYQSYLDDAGNNQYGLRDASFHAIDGQLYSEKRDMRGALDEGAYSLEQLLRDLERRGDCSCAWPANKRSKSDMLEYVSDFLDSHVLIDGVVYEKRNEPRYVVMTFGLGHNHGGTALMVTTNYNDNISRDNYFNALQFEEAVDYADKVAAARGDTKNIGTFGNRRITVLMPEMVRCAPNAEHGPGDPFINQMETLARAGNSVLESGLLVLAGASSALSKEKKPSLTERIEDAATRATNNSTHIKEKNCKEER